MKTNMKTKTGAVVTDEMLEQWADSFEGGTWPAGKTVVLGRPSIADEDSKLVTFRLPVSKIAAMDEKAAKCGETRSGFLRSLVDRDLASI